MGRGDPESGARPAMMCPRGNTRRTTAASVDRFHETNRIRRMELKHTQTSS